MNGFTVDYFLITPSAGGTDSGVETSRDTPSSTPTQSTLTQSTPTQSTLPIVATRSTPVGAIVGGVVGSIAGIAILAVALWYLLRKSRGGRAYYSEKPTLGGILADERL